MNEEILKLVLELGDNANNAVYVLMAISAFKEILLFCLIVTIVYLAYKVILSMLGDARRKYREQSLYRKIAEKLDNNEYITSCPDNNDYNKLVNKLFEKLDKND